MFTVHTADATKQFRRVGVYLALDIRHATNYFFVVARKWPAPKRRHACEALYACRSVCPCRRIVNSGLAPTIVRQAFVVNGEGAAVSIRSVHYKIGRYTVVVCKLRYYANKGCKTCASVAGLLFTFIAVVIKALGWSFLQLGQCMATPGVKS